MHHPTLPFFNKQLHSFCVISVPFCHLPQVFPAAVSMLAAQLLTEAQYTALLARRTPAQRAGLEPKEAAFCFGATNMEQGKACLEAWKGAKGGLAGALAAVAAVLANPNSTAINNDTDTDTDNARAITNESSSGGASSGGLKRAREDNNGTAGGTHGTREGTRDGTHHDDVAVVQSTPPQPTGSD